MVELRVVGGEAGERIALTLETSDDLCRLVCTLRGQEHVAEASDFFEALVALRRAVLEPLGLIPVCYGASVDVWPSEMARQMGQGLSAYRMVPGEHTDELVDIFASDSDVEPASVAEQAAYARAWSASLER